MQFFSETLTLKIKTFQLIRDLIHEQLGIYFEESKADLLADKLSPLVLAKGFTSFMDYYYFLKYDNAGDEWLNITDALTVGETFFFREQEQIWAVADILIPRLMEEYKGAPIEIWSAACSSGEEPLSIAMAINERGWFEKYDIKIWATDVSRKAVSRAKAGVFRDWSFRGVHERYVEKYFIKGSEGNRIREDILERVSFDRLNLMDRERVLKYARAPIIFCRNVFIYFSQEAILRVISAMYEGMPNPGFLFLSSSESLLRIFPSLELQGIGNAFVYVKK